MKAMNKTERKAILSEQGGCCPCCENPLPLAGQKTAYDAKKNTIICKQCSVVLFNIRHLTPYMIDYEASQVQPSPKSEAQRAVEAGKVINTATGKPYASWAEALARHPGWAHSGGRTIDKEGNIYDKEGTVIGNTEEGRQ